MLGISTIFKCSLFIVSILFIEVDLSYSQLIINEVSASNKDLIADSEGLYYDWIEMLNTGTQTIDLAEYSLSDDKSNISKWNFPEYQLNPDEYLLLFASGKDIIIPPSYWQTIVNQGDSWKYIVPTANISSWRTLEFSDNSWQEGPSGIGYGDGDDSTVISSNPTSLSLYMRISFNVEDVSQLLAASLHIDYDDGFVAYINGIEIARMGVAGSPPDFNALANPQREAIIYSGGPPECFDISDPGSIFQNGENILAIEVHNTSSTSSDLSSIPFLSILTPADPGIFPPEILDLSDHLLHTNFKLDADGDLLYLSNSAGSIIDSLIIVAQYPNHSYGRIPGGFPVWKLFDAPTPGSKNSTASFSNYMNRTPTFSESGGKFTNPFQLTLSSSEPDDTIYYTTDGSEPEITSAIYSEPISVSNNIVIRARIIKHGYISGPALTNTYYQQSSNGLPVIAISTDPYNMWDYNYGIYVDGPNAENNFPYFGSNFWNDWERPVNVSMYDSDTLAFSIDAGIKIYGGYSRGHPQKSFSIFARSKYGAGEIKYQLFEDRPVYEFESFILRNSGNDWFGQESQSGTMMRDVLMTRLTKNMNIESQGSRQAVVYINDEYWGVHNIRDKINEHFLASSSGASPDNIELLERDKEVIIGSNQHYVDLIDFVSNNSLENSSNYSYVKKQIDIQNYINYELSQIYFDNRDWPGNNIKFWREDGPSSQWRWIMFDTDFGFGLWDLNKVYYNTLDFALDPNQTEWPNPAWSTLLLRRLIENKEFKEQFINSFADQINTSFISKDVSDLIDEIKYNFSLEMSRHVQRWGGSYQNWVNNVNSLKDFAEIRPAAMQNFIRGTFRTGPKHELTLSISSQNAGSIKLNSLLHRKFPWNGIYFQDVPVKLTAIPSPGYIFTSWTGGVNSTEATISVNLSKATSITANFELNSRPENRIIINEICYNSDPQNSSEDWVELYNKSSQYVDLSGWIIKDENIINEYIIKEGTILAPDKYYVISKDKYALSRVHPEIIEYQGNFDFGLSSQGDVVILENRDRGVEDMLSYGIIDPWPTIAIGSGYSLSLLSPELDNFNAESWAISDVQYGTPGRCNSCISSVEEKQLDEHKDILLQNYPNPFSNSTRIVYHLYGIQDIKLSVYDLNGRLVEVLINQMMEEGYYEIAWQAQYLTSGIYVLKLETSTSLSTKLMIKLD